MTDEAMVGLLAMLVSTVVLPAVSLPLTRRAADGRLGPNDVAGIRTRATKASDAAWRAGHGAALPFLAPAVPVAVAVVVLAVTVQLVGGGTWGVAVAAVGFAAELGIVLRSAWVADRAARLVTE